MRAPTAVLLLATGCMFDAAGVVEDDVGDGPREQPSELRVTCDVVVAGGSTAALAAALTSAREGADTCLLEPVDWVGGQLTASGVPAIDFAWHKVGALDVGAIAKDRANLPAEFGAWMDDAGNPGRCWVSTSCFRPDWFLDTYLQPAVAGEPNLRVFYRTVVKRVDTTPGAEGARITGLLALRRPADPAERNRFLSDQLASWYDPADKEAIRFSAAVFIDATELGDLLALSGAPYMQGVEVVDGSPDALDDTCGQATVFPLIARYHGSAQAEPGNPLPVDHPGFYGLGRFTWDQVWRYRRVSDGAGAGYANDYSLQNWNPGNDYPYGYLLVDKATAAAQRADWRGGVDLDTIAAAERHAYGWYYWLKAREPGGQSSRITLDRTLLGTGTGLAKLPYVRDTRRSVGLENFVLASGHLRGEAAKLTGTRFADRIAIGSYAIDVHPLTTCALPGYVSSPGEPLPFYIPLRALTNRDVENLLVAGKTMAQSFVTNAATRLQPIEWSSGIGAGATAAHMSLRGIGTARGALADVRAIQTRVRNHAPLEWRIGGVRYPRSGEQLPPIADRIYCPTGTRFDEGYGFCTDDVDAYGPFTRAMTARCLAYDGGDACHALHPVTVAGRTLALPRWSKTFARAIRGDGDCPLGATREAAYLGHCVERTTVDGELVEDVYGPFGSDLVSACVEAEGGDACYTHRWSAPFFRYLASRL